VDVNRRGFIGAIAAVLTIGRSASQVKNVTVTPNEAQFLNSRTLCVEEIARVFGVPPGLLGLPPGRALRPSELCRVDVIDNTEGRAAMFDSDHDLGLQIGDAVVFDAMMFPIHGITFTGRVCSIHRQLGSGPRGYYWYRAVDDSSS